MFLQVPNASNFLDFVLSAALLLSFTVNVGSLVMVMKLKRKASGEDESGGVSLAWCARIHSVLDTRLESLEGEVKENRRAISEEVHTLSTRFVKLVDDVVKTIREELGK